MIEPLSNLLDISLARHTTVSQTLFLENSL